MTRNSCYLDCWYPRPVAIIPIHTNSDCSPLFQLTIKFNIMFHTEIGSSPLPGGWGRGGEGRRGIIHLFYFHPVDLLNADMESHKTDFIFRLCCGNKSKTIIV